MFLLPSLVFFLAFVIVPMVLCVYTSFFDSTMGKETRDVFIGFGNYIELFRDSVFLRALKNTIIIVVVSVPITCIFSLWISSAIYQMPGKLLSFFRIVFYLPVITGSVAVTVVWKWMFNNYYGIFNYLGTQTGLISQRINWLGDERYALGCIILILLTTSVGQPIVLYVSALGNVDSSLIEAAEVDGATDLQVFWKINADPIVNFRRSQPQHGYRHVLHLLHCIQAVPLRVRKRDGCCPCDLYRGAFSDSVQARQREMR